MPTFPLSPFREAENLIFISGQIGQQEGKLVSENITEQTAQAVSNIENILKQAGLTLESIVDVTAFIVDQEDYNAFNDAYAKAFPQPYPSRTTVTVKSLPLNARVELKAIAQK